MTKIFAISDTHREMPSCPESNIWIHADDLLEEIKNVKSVMNLV